ncbi:hypothetical protein MMPV_000976 [Pyropia vietnamensis]
MATNGPNSDAAAAVPPIRAPVADTPVAIVTGANSGIGLAVCVALAHEGHTVYGGMRVTASADALLAAAGSVKPPGAIHVVRMDVGNDDSVATAVAGILAATGDRVDVAVANAGYGERASVEAVPMSAYTDTMNVNFFGALRLVQACVPSMRRRRAGRMLGVSSVMGLVGLPFMSSYTASKSAMEGFWESAHSEYKSLGIHFILVEPGPVSTPLLTRPPKPWSLPAELESNWQAWAVSCRDLIFVHPQTPDDCAASFVRAVKEPEPALRYMTHPPCAEMVRSKMVDLDGKRVAAMALSLVATKGSEEGSTQVPAEAERSDK